VQALLFSAEEAERLRGPQACFLWCDELASWRFLDDVLDNALFGLRLGPHPKTVITTTPRPSKRLRQILNSPHTVVTRGSTRDNAANLAASAVERLYSQYGGTRLGRQELEAEILDDNPAALWKLSDIDETRVAKAPALRRIVVAVDPAVTSRVDSDETGIMVVGIGPCACMGKADDHAFVLEDLSGTFSPDRWARETASAYERHRADKIVAEANQGGDLVVANLRTQGRYLPVSKVHATKGKMIRAEPVAALYEQRRVHHVGNFPKLEDQLVGWDPTSSQKSPDRLDALVWALSELVVSKNSGPNFVPLDIGGPRY
jgi:phage terminase large subunit-like protein